MSSYQSPFDLSGRVAIVTGGNRGIGYGIAEGLVRAGASVFIVGRDVERGAQAAQELSALGGRVEFGQFDLSAESAGAAMIADCVSRFGRLDILVNNAGINIRKRPEDYTPVEWHKIVETNLTSLFFCCQAAYPEMVKAGGGKIINIASMSAVFGLSFAAPYSASKGAVVQLTKSLAVSWAAQNIQVNAILPGYIDTELTVRARKDVDGLNDRVIARTPAARWGTPADLAGLAVLYAGRGSDFMTGTAVLVDGGYASNG